MYVASTQQFCHPWVPTPSADCGIGFALLIESMQHSLATMRHPRERES